MKYVKMLGLAAVAAMALMAFVGAGTASAVPVVCSTTVSPCPAAQEWGNGIALDFSSENSTGTGAGFVELKDTSGIFQNKCESTVQGTLTNNTSGAPTMSNVSITWTSCTRTVKNEKIGTLSIDTIAGSSDGTVTADTEFQVTTKIPGFFGEPSCVYKATAGQSLGTLREGNPPTMKIEAVVTPIAGQPAECPSTANWEGAYKLTTQSGTTGSLSHN